MASKNYVKAIAGGLAALGAGVAAVIADQTIGLPPSVLAILTVLVQVGVVAGIVYKVPNVLTTEQVVSQVKNVSPEVLVQHAPEIVKPIVVEAVKQVKNVVPVEVPIVGDQVSEAIELVLKRFGA